MNRLTSSLRKGRELSQLLLHRLIEASPLAENRRQVIPMPNGPTPRLITSNDLQTDRLQLTPSWEVPLALE